MWKMLTAYLFYEMKDSHRCSKFLGIAHTEGDVWKANSKYWGILTGKKASNVVVIKSFVKIPSKVWRLKQIHLQNSNTRSGHLAQ